MIFKRTVEYEGEIFGPLVIGFLKVTTKVWFGFGWAGGTAVGY